MFSLIHTRVDPCGDLRVVDPWRFGTLTSVIQATAGARGLELLSANVTSARIPKRDTTYVRSMA